MTQVSQSSIWSGVASRSERGMDAVAADECLHTKQPFAIPRVRYTVYWSEVWVRAVVVVANAAVLPLLLYGVHVLSGQKATLVNTIIEHDGFQATYWNAAIVFLGIGVFTLLPLIRLRPRAFHLNPIVGTGTAGTGSDETPLRGLKGN